MHWFLRLLISILWEFLNLEPEVPAEEDSEQTKKYLLFRDSVQCIDLRSLVAILKVFVGSVYTSLRSAVSFKKS